MKATRERPRLLCLHGACSNSEITKMQIIGLNLRDKFDITYMNAPHVVSHPSPGLENFADGPYYAWSDPARSLEIREDQWNESMEYVVRRLRDDAPFDGVYGFSQGAAMITNLSHPKSVDVWKGGGSNRYSSGDGGKLPWQFAILACGAGCHNITESRFGDDCSIDVPSFHIFGKNDRYANDSRTIYDYWSADDRAMHVHGRGHEIDAMMHTREHIMMGKLRTFLDEQRSRRRRAEGGGGFASGIR